MTGDAARGAGAGRGLSVSQAHSTKTAIPVGAPTTRFAITKAHVIGPSASRLAVAVTASTPARASHSFHEDRSGGS